MNYYHGRRIYYRCFAQQESNLGYGDRSKYLAYFIESQVVGCGI